jgi:uncharacterized protein
MPGSLCDVNVLLALAHERHAHSRVAARWIESVGGRDAVLVCRVSQLGLLRLLTSPRILADEALTAQEAWTTWESLLSDERFSFADEPPSLGDRWKAVSRELQPGGVVGTDAYLAAFALAARCELVTFDSGFRRFTDLRLRLLLST